MTKNAIGSIFFLIFSSFYFYNVFNIKQMPGSQFEIMTASTFPYYVGLAGLIVSLILFVVSFVEKEKIYLSMSYLKTLDFKTTLYFILAMFFYGFTISNLGFIIATIIFLSVGFIILKERNVKKIFLISFGVSIGFYLLLNNVLGVYINPGIFLEQLLGVK